MKSPKTLLAGFPILLFLLAAAFAWLVWRLLEQDRSLEQQRSREALETMADRIQISLQNTVNDLRNQAGQLLAGMPPAPEVPDNVALMVAEQNSLKVFPDRRLLYYPDQVPELESTELAFARGEKLEYYGNNLPAAASEYRQLIASTDLRIRAGALLRLARAMRRMKLWDESLTTLADLEKLDPQQVASLPAGFLAAQMRCRVLKESGRRTEWERAIAGLRRELLAGRWRLPKSAFEIALDETRPVSADSVPNDLSVEELAVAAAVEGLWQNRPMHAATGQRFTRHEQQPVLICWSASPAKFAALVAGPRFLRALLSKVSADGTMQVGLADAEGQLLMGNLGAASTLQAFRPAAATHMPWSLHLSTIANPDPAYLQRRRLLLVGIALMTAILLGGAYLSWRAASRELAVARLQSDFVAAVSHEFRSPLTAVVQMSELLSLDRLPGESQRRRSYDIICRESRRLQRLVENLLDFGRMETGELRYAFESLDLSELTGALVQEFRNHLGAGDHSIEVSLAPGSLLVCADREALERALWNLLDNAVKYSPESKRILVETWRLDSSRAAVKVQDWGLGIPPVERERIFAKFVRGSNVQGRAIRGTGLGLTMVRHTVQSHKGEIRIESEQGRGSTFTLLIPLEEKT